jgi:ABC-2 type transport system permease protein
MMLLSGCTTPMESMPVWLQYVMKTLTPMPHFVEFAQNVLFRDAGLSIVWPEILAMSAIGAVYFGIALYRKRCPDRT